MPPARYANAVDRLDAALQEIDKGEVGKLASSSEVVALMMPIAFEVPLSGEAYSMGSTRGRGPVGKAASI